MKELFNLIPAEHHEAAKKHIRDAVEQMLSQAVPAKADPFARFDTAELNIKSLTVIQRLQIINSLKKVRELMKPGHFICSHLRAQMTAPPNVLNILLPRIDTALINILPENMRNVADIRTVVSAYGIPSVIALCHARTQEVLTPAIANAKKQRVGLAKSLGANYMRINDISTLIVSAEEGAKRVSITVNSANQYAFIHPAVAHDYPELRDRAQAISHDVRVRFLNAIIKSAESQL